MIGKDIDDLRDPNINHYISQSDTRGIATLFADDLSAQQLCNQMGYQTGSIEDSYWNVECSGLKHMVISQITTDRIALNAFDDDKR